MKRIAIVDPAMFQHSGHHRELNLAKAAAYIASGYQVDIYTSNRYPEDPGSSELKNLRVIPHFTSQPYQDGQKHKLHFGVEDYLLPAARLFADELREIDGDCPLLLPSAFPYQICGAALAGWQHPVHAVTHRSPDFFANHPATHWRHAFEMSESLNKPLGFHVFEPVLQKLFEQCAGRKVRIRVAPFPLRPVVETQVVRQSNCIGMLGGLRGEQGLRDVPNVVNALLRCGFKVLNSGSATRTCWSAPSRCQDHRVR